MYLDSLQYCVYSLSCSWTIGSAEECFQKTHIIYNFKQQQNITPLSNTLQIIIIIIINYAYRRLMFKIHQFVYINALIVSIHLWIRVYLSKDILFLQVQNITNSYSHKRILYNLYQYYTMQQSNNPNPTHQQGISINDYTFTLRSLNVPNAPITVTDFSPAYHEINNNYNKTRNVVKTKTSPIFNNDGIHFTPSFMIHIDQLKTHQHLKAFQKLHQDKRLEVVQQKSQLMIPMPKKDALCCVCKIQYEDFLEHMADPLHILKLRKNPFSKDINKLCSKFKTNKRQKKAEKIMKPKEVKEAKGRKVNNKKVSKLTYCPSTEPEIQNINDNQIQ